VVVVVRSVRWQLSTLRPPRGQVSRAHAADLGELADASFATSDGLTLRGWYHPSKNHAAVVLVHGWAATREQLLPEARILARHGYGVLLFDWRAHGESDGVKSTWGDVERRDLIAALDYLGTRADADPQRLGALGFSFGGGVAIDVAAADARLKAVVTEGTTPTLEETIDENAGRFKLLSAPAGRWAMRRALDVDAVRPLDHVCAIHPRPILIINGDDGKDQPERMAKELFDAACEPKDYWHLAGAGHGDYATVAPAELERRLVAFFDAALVANRSASK
jgi:dipeptidyl aminopeptidase/acylaminoacyl peptidase